MQFLCSGCIGPRGDGYDPGKIVTAEEAQAYHAWQVSELPEAWVDFVSAFTMNNINEPVGVARAAQAARIPCAISFTVETDGRLPTGDRLDEAIEAVDTATGQAPAQPTHFEHVLGWRRLDETVAWADGKLVAPQPCGTRQRDGAGRRQP